MDNASSYLSILLNDIEQTKNYLAAYNNQILFLQGKYPGNELQESLSNASKLMGDQEKTMLINTIGFFRTYSTRAYIGFKSIQKKFDISAKQKISEVEDCYQIIKKHSIPSYEKCELFVQSLSDITVNEINVQALVNTQTKTSSLAQASESPDL